VLEREGAEPVRVDTDAMPLHGGAVSVLVRLLAVQWAAVVADATGGEREEHDRPPVPQPLLHRLLPDLPHQYRLRSAHDISSRQMKSSTRGE
jgi:hypothetical protein